MLSWAVVVVQLVEWSLPTPEICGSNLVFGKVLPTNCIIEKTKIMKKRPGTAHLKKLNVFPYFRVFKLGHQMVL